MVVETVEINSYSTILLLLCYFATLLLVTLTCSYNIAIIAIIHSTRNWALIWRSCDISNMQHTFSSIHTISEKFPQLNLDPATPILVAVWTVSAASSAMMSSWDTSSAGKGKGKFLHSYTAQCPVLRIAQSILHFTALWTGAMQSEKTMAAMLWQMWHESAVNLARHCKLYKVISLEYFPSCPPPIRVPGWSFTFSLRKRQPTSAKLLLTSLTRLCLIYVHTYVSSLREQTTVIDIATKTHSLF